MAKAWVNSDLRDLSLGTSLGDFREPGTTCSSWGRRKKKRWGMLPTALHPLRKFQTLWHRLTGKPQGGQKQESFLFGGGQGPKKTSLVAQMVKNLPAMWEALFSGLGRSPGEGNGYPLQYSCLENSTDRGAWRATVHGVSSRTWLEQLVRQSQSN